MKSFVGKQWDVDTVEDIRCCFSGNTEIIVKDSENNGYDKIAYKNIKRNTPQILFKLDENNKIADCWKA